MVCTKFACYWCLHLRKFLFGNQPFVIVCCVIVGGDGDVKAVDVVVNVVDVVLKKKFYRQNAPVAATGHC